MSKYIIQVKSTDNTDMIIFADKIQYVLQKGVGCIVGMDNGDRLHLGVSFEDFNNVLGKWY